MAEENWEKIIDRILSNGYMGLSRGGLHDILSSGYAIYDIIFSCQFAEAFWGDEMEIVEIGDSGEQLYEVDNDVYMLPAWQYHLQQMVILPDDEKFKYLEKFL